MAEREHGSFFERFDILQQAQADLERHGYFLHAVHQEHTEGFVTGPLLHRIQTHITKRGFRAVAGHLAITFSGYSRDPREVHEIPEVRTFWRVLDSQLPELPALLTTLPAFAYNGPGLHLMFLGKIDAVVPRPSEGMYDAHVIQGPAITEDAVRRIRQAGRKYHLGEPAVSDLINRFKAGAGVA